MGLIKRLQRRYHAPTPKIYELIGDRIIDLGTAVQVIFATAQASGYEVRHPFIVAIIIALLTWLGKTLTKFSSIAQDGEEQKKSQDEPGT